MFRLALIQMKVIGGHKEEDLRHAEALLAEAARDAEVLLLPEAMSLGWTHPDSQEQADPIPDGLTCALLRAAARQLAPAFQEAELDEEGGAQQCGSRIQDEFQGRACGAAGGQQIVRQQHAVSGPQSIQMHLHAVRAVLQAVVQAARLPWQLALFPHRHKPGAQLLGDHGAKDEAARFGPGDHVNMQVAERLGQIFDGEGETGGVGQQRGDVLEDDAGLGKVGDVANEVAKPSSAQLILKVHKSSKVKSRPGRRYGDWRATASLFGGACAGA